MREIFLIIMLIWMHTLFRVVLALEVTGSLRAFHPACVREGMLSHSSTCLLFICGVCTLPVKSVCALAQTKVQVECRSN